MNKHIFPGRAMYRSISALFFILISISAFAVDSRVERWNLRIERMKKIQDDASSGRFNRTIIDDIIKGELQSSAEFIDLLNRYKKEDGSLKSETKKYSLTEIEKKVKEISLPAISLYYMSDLYRTAGDMQVKENIAADILRYAAAKFGASIKINQTDSYLMAENYIIEKGVAEFDSAVKSATTDILSKTEYELSRSDYNSNESDLSRIIQKHIEDPVTAVKFPESMIFNEKYLLLTPQWKFIEEQYSGIEERKKSVINFVYAAGVSVHNKNQINDIETAEKEIFDKAKEKISDMLQDTTPGSGAGGSNPYYEIPDLRKLGVAIDEIDRYRKTLMQNINGSENKDLISKLKSNNTGIASRSINRIDAQFKSEEARIERLKKIKGAIIIYNEEVFKASKTHFYNVRDEIYKYADLSAEFIGALYSSGKNDPQKYIEFHRYRSDRYILYISFSEKLTANTSALSLSGSEKLKNLYKGTIQKVLAASKNLLKPGVIPTDVRGTLGKENLKEYAAINSDFRIKGSLLISSSRKNYDECIAGFSRAALSNKESSIDSEIQIGQDETDRLFNFAKKCSSAIAGMNYTENSLQKYKEEYTRVSDELKKGNKPAGFSSDNTLLTFFISVPGFKPELIEQETATRELIAKEGMEALSGSITLVQYYKKKGISVKFAPTAEEINSMKISFSKSPGIDISSWKMNGRNFRQIDLNITAELKKLMNKNAWNTNSNNSVSEFLNIDEAGISVSFSPPAGWEKLPDSRNDHVQKIIFQSPDMKCIVEVTSIYEKDSNLQNLAGLWPEKSGFSMTEKNWGKKNNSDYIKSTAKNRYDGIMESYMFAKNGYVIILSGKTTGDMYRQMNKILSEIFRNLEVKG